MIVTFESSKRRARREFSEEIACILPRITIKSSTIHFAGIILLAVILIIACLPRAQSQNAPNALIILLAVPRARVAHQLAAAPAFSFS